MSKLITCPICGYTQLVDGFLEFHFDHHQNNPQYHPLTCPNCHNAKLVLTKRVLMGWNSFKYYKRKQSVKRKWLKV